MDLNINHFKSAGVEPASKPIIPKRLDIRLGYLFSLVSIWIGFSLFGTSRFGGAEWQNGNLGTYFDLSFAESVWILFAPFLAYSTISMLLLLWDSERFSLYWLVRFGIYTGFFLTVQFCLQVAMSEELVIGLGIGAVVIFPMIVGYVALKLGVAYLWRNRDDKKVLWIGIPIIVVALATSVYWMGLVIVGALCSAVAASPLIAGVTSYRLWQTHDRDLSSQALVKITSLMTWGTFWGTSGVIAINRVFDLYTQLPTEPPDCYVATASAKGHVKLVGSRPVQLANGSILQVSGQLQILKAGELVMRELAPSLHRSIRIVYDWIGPKLANRIQSPWIADIGYLFFKPFEWMTLFFMKIFFYRQMQKIDRFYLGCPGEQSNKPIENAEAAEND